MPLRHSASRVSIVWLRVPSPLRATTTTPQSSVSRARSARVAPAPVSSTSRPPAPSTTTWSWSRASAVIVARWSSSVGSDGVLEPGGGSGRHRRQQPHALVRRDARQASHLGHVARVVWADSRLGGFVCRHAQARCPQRRAHGRRHHRLADVGVGAGHDDDPGKASRRDDGGATTGGATTGRAAWPPVTPRPRGARRRRRR